jgi:membrane protein YqaA with SNARE-associated domain
VNLWATPAAQAAAHRTQRAHALHWLTHLGLPGVFGVAAIDASPIPLPIPGTTDLMLLWLSSHKIGNAEVMVLCAVTGSLLGGYFSWNLGRKGGETALKRRVPARLLNPVQRWAKSNPSLAVFLPALLPPPVPLSPFLLASGALGVPVRRFLVAFGTARSIRYSLVAWLGVTYGRPMNRLWSNTLDKWSAPLLWVFAALVLAGIVFAIVNARRRPKGVIEGRPANESAAD